MARGPWRLFWCGSGSPAAPSGTPVATRVLRCAVACRPHLAPPAGAGLGHPPAPTEDAGRAVSCSMSCPNGQSRYQPCHHVPHPSSWEQGSHCCQHAPAHTRPRSSISREPYSPAQVSGCPESLGTHEGSQPLQAAPLPCQGQPPQSPEQPSSVCVVKTRPWGQ